MALAKPVMAYIRPDLPPALPSAGVFPTSPNSFETDLIGMATAGKERMAELGESNRRCWEKQHSPAAIQKTSHELYEDVLNRQPRKVRYLDLAVLCKPEGLGTPETAVALGEHGRSLLVRVARAVLSTPIGAFLYRMLSKIGRI